MVRGEYASGGGGFWALSYGDSGDGIRGYIE